MFHALLALTLVSLPSPIYGDDQCRVCRDVATSESMISPCHCSGSIRYIHFDCLKQSIQANGQLKCTVCNEVYSGVKIVRKKPSIWSFLRDDPSPIFFVAFMVVMTFMLLDYGKRKLAAQVATIHLQTTRVRRVMACLAAFGFALALMMAMVFLVLGSNMMFQLFYDDYRLYCFRFPIIEVLPEDNDH